MRSEGLCSALTDATFPLHHMSCMSHTHFLTYRDQYQQDCANFWGIYKVLGSLNPGSTQLELNNNNQMLYPFFVTLLNAPHFTKMILHHQREGEFQIQTWQS